MKPTVTIATLALLLMLPACDKKEEPTRPDLKAPPAKKADDGKTDGKAAEGQVAGRGGPGATAGRVFFVAPADGAKVGEQFEVEFGVEGKEIEPAGATERDSTKGHHHLLIDTGAIPDMQIVPKDETHLHYGDGATKATVKLPPGKHQLTMQLADGAHRSYGPEWAATITVEVEAGGGEPAAGDAAKGDEPNDPALQDDAGGVG